MYKGDRDTDRQTDDGWTLHDGIGHTCIASCGKKML